MILSLCGIGRLQLLRVPGEELLIQTTICGYVARRGANHQQNYKTWGCNRKSSQRIGRLTVETHLTGTVAGIFTRTVVANGHMNNHCVGLRSAEASLEGWVKSFVQHQGEGNNSGSNKAMEAKATNEKCDKKKQNEANINKHMGDESRSQHCGCNQSKWGIQQSKVK